MSITNQMLANQKLGATIRFSYPEENPEFVFEVQRMALGERAFMEEDVLLSNEVQQDGKFNQVQFGKLLGRKMFDKFKEKLRGWEHKSFEYNEENKKLFYDSLSLENRQQIVGAYGRKLNEEFKEAEGNVATLEKGSSKPQKAE